MTQSCSLIISTYNWPKALDLVLLSVLSQKKLPSEIIIADDGSDNTTKDLINTYKNRFPVPLIHVWRENTGFTKTLTLNKAIKHVTSPYIVQVDGDIILHPMFIQDHLDFSEKNCWINGSRVLLGEKKSKAIIKSKNIELSPFIEGITNRINALHAPILRDLFFSKKKLDIKKVRGCNMSYWKSDFEKINGYNEDIIGWGREDSELATRLINNNIFKKQLKFGGIEFHIYHPEASRNKLSLNDNIQKKAINDKLKYCKNGYFKD